MDTISRAFIWFLLCSLSIPSLEGQKTNIQLCVPEDLINECHTMANLFPGLITCISAKDKFACMGTIARGEADTMNVDPEDLYLAGSIFGLEPFLMEEYERKRFRYRAAVLIPKNTEITSVNDLRGKKSCHTGYGRNAGWYMPMGQLIFERVIQQDCRSLLHTAAGFFSQSCLPGRWSKDPLVDRHLKRQHPKLCELCKDPYSCSDSDEYAGYEGAIKCLVDGQGEVAFTTIEAVVQLFGKLSPDIIDNYQFLCPNGAREKINYNACDWGKRPNNVWIIRPDRLQDPRRAQDRKLFYNFLEQIHFRNKVTPTRPFPPLWFDKVFVSSVNVTNILKIVGPGGRDTMTYGEYLGDYVNSINLPVGCNKKVIRLCTSSQAELFKCLDLQKVAYSRRITPEIRCENPGYSLESCIRSVASGASDLISLEASDFYKAARYRGLKPIARERSNGTNIASYAVAVVRVPSEVNSLQDLANASVCSTGFGDTSGWTSPMGVLISQSLIPRETCSRSAEVSKFFRSMCVPGAGDFRYNVNVSGADVLCRLCSGDGKGGHICEKSSTELYSGETGAFRCLAERKGDVAFVSHTTPLRYSDRSNFNANEYWATSLRSDDFRLLCSSGGQAAITDYEKCNMAQIPSRFIVTRNNINYENYTHIVTLLSSLSEVFTGKARYSFKLFGHYEGESNLLFGDNTNSIVALEEDADYTQELGNFLPILRNMDQVACENSGHLITSSTILISIFTIILSLLINTL